MKEKSQQNKCLIEGCCSLNKSFYVRGLCRSHYSLMAYTIKKGLHTWEEFIDFGMALPLKRIDIKTCFEEMLRKKLKVGEKNKKK